MKQFALFGILLLILALGLSEWPQQVSAVALAQPQPQKGPKAPPSGGNGNQQSGQGQNGQNGQSGQNNK
ncbi:uncharacterized protein LOC108159283 [Drosophila miranda]|uniref:uncharacterized protein LOC108159283 n=1 Tax=Drosophila miranda TaxID=7229 RepID=UPI0007E86333|nr:uncharacterized protein LOC108159283 [Drosophila miranda]